MSEQPIPSQDDQAAREAAAEAWMAKMRAARAQDEAERPKRLTLSALDDLERSRALIMSLHERNERKASGLLLMREEDAMRDCGDPILAATRLNRALRHTVILQEEMLGNRPVPGTRAPAQPTGDPEPDETERLEHDREPADRERHDRDPGDRDRPDADKDRPALADIVATLGELAGTDPVPAEELASDRKVLMQALDELEGLFTGDPEPPPRRNPRAAPKRSRNRGPPSS